MASILTTAAQRVNADTAGRTTDPAEADPGAPSGATGTEVFQRVFTTASGALDSLFRQEPMSPPVTNPAGAVPSAATPGPHGGLVPAALRNIVSGAAAPSPGPGPELAAQPAGQGAAHSAVAAAEGFATDTTHAATTALATLRRVFRI